MFPCIMTKLILSGHGKSLPLQPSKTIFFTLRFFTCIKGATAKVITLCSFYGLTAADSFLSVFVYVGPVMP